MSYFSKFHIFFKSLACAIYVSILEMSIFLLIYTFVDWMCLDKDIIHSSVNSISMIFYKLTNSFIIVQIMLLTIWYYYIYTQMTMKNSIVIYGGLFTILISSFFINLMIGVINAKESFALEDLIIQLFGFGFFANETPYFPIFITSSFTTIFLIKFLKLEANYQKKNINL